MPELPEVETVRKTLEPMIVGKTIKDVIVRFKGILKSQTEEEFKELLIGQTVRAMKRRGKYLIFEMDDYSMVSHLRMEGKYFFKKDIEDFNKHDHIAFKFDDTYLVYNDTRKFGTMDVIKKGTEMEFKPIKALGYEPFDLDINRDLVQKRLHANRPIKTLLLDQTILTGLGNIYVDEVCFMLKVHPTVLGKTLSNRVDEIVLASDMVLRKAIALGGTTIRSYSSVDGVTGRFQLELNVHMRKGEPCIECGSLIEKTKVGGRGTYYCPKCQPMED